MMQITQRGGFIVKMGKGGVTIDDIKGLASQAQGLDLRADIIQAPVGGLLADGLDEHIDGIVQAEDAPITIDFFGEVRDENPRASAHIQDPVILADMQTLGHALQLYRVIVSHSVIPMLRALVEEISTNRFIQGLNSAQLYSYQCVMPTPASAGRNMNAYRSKQAE